MTWGAESQGQTDRFEAQPLDPSRALDLEHSATLSVGAGAPNVDAQGGAAGDAKIDLSSGKSAWRRRLAPHHRDAVRDFFAPAGKANDERR